MTLLDVLAGRRRWWVENCDVLDGLRAMPDESVHCVVTSPPYWGLRDYGVEGQIGLEPTFPEYLAGMVSLFDEVRRVLRKDGSLWLNIGDGYAGSWGAQSRPGYADDSSTLQGGSMLSARQIAAHPTTTQTGSAKRTPGLKPKDLIGAPWRLAFGLQEAGWWLRCDVIWAKPNPMPESTKDRPTKAHEYLFLMTKSGRYHYDAAAIAEPASHATTKMPDGWDTGPGGHGSYHRNGREKGAKVDKQCGHGRRHAGFSAAWDAMSRAEQCGGTRNKRSVWTIAPAAFSDAHFATFPPELVEPCILAGCPKDGVVLDPFAGSGTTLMVALRHGRRGVGLELNPPYVEMARRRIVGDAPMWNRQPEPAG